MTISVPLTRRAKKQAAVIQCVTRTSRVCRGHRVRLWDLVSVAGTESATRESYHFQLLLPASLEPILDGSDPGRPLEGSIASGLPPTESSAAALGIASDEFRKGPAGAGRVTSLSSDYSQKCPSSAFRFSLGTRKGESHRTALCALVRARQEQLEADVRRTWSTDPIIFAGTKGTCEAPPETLCT